MKKAILSVFLLAAATAGAQQALTPESLWHLKRVSDPQVSPDGKYVLYTVRTYSIPENAGQADIYLMETASGNQRAICAGPENETAPRWISATRFAYLRPDSNGIDQVHVRHVTAGPVVRASSAPVSVTNYGYAPDGSMVWYTCDVKVDAAVTEKYPDLPKATGRIFDDLMFRHWNTWEDGSYSHLFVQPCSDGLWSGQPTDLMPGERFDTPMQPFGGDEQIAWSPDGKKVAYTCKKLTGKDYAVSTNSEIYIHDLASGTTTTVTLGLPGYDINPRFSPDGRRILWLSMATAGYEADRNRIMIQDLATGKNTDLTEGFDYSVSSAEWSNDGKLVYFLCGINATEQLWSLDPAKPVGSRIRQITGDIGDHTAFTFSGSGPRTVMVTAMMSMSQPTELYRINLTKGESTQLTFVNDDLLDEIEFGTVEKRMVKATDGKSILTWVIYPPGFDPSQSYPTLLYCQGGPQSTVSQFFSYRWNFQIMAANGYIVVAPNRRGLPSFGTEWNREISGDWGGQCMRDYLSAIDDVSSEPYVDKNRMGCVGASFGGYSVYWLAGHHEKRFKAFIAHCGVFNLKSMYGSTEELWFPDFDLGGPYWKDPQNVSYTRFSPIDYVGRWDTPMLIIHNEKDFRVPLTQGMEAFTAARVQDIPARFLYFPDEGHWVNKPQNGILWQRVFFDWLDRYLKPAGHRHDGH